MSKGRKRQDALRQPVKRCNKENCTYFGMFSSWQSCKTFLKIVKEGKTLSSCPYYCYSKEMAQKIKQRKEEEFKKQVEKYNRPHKKSKRNKFLKIKNS